MQIDEFPDYKLCLLRKDNNTSDAEIFERVKSSGTTYYKYYAIIENQVEKLYITSIKEAENIITGLKEQNSENKEQVAYIEKYSTELKEFTGEEEAISVLYVKPVIPDAQYTSTGYANTSQTINTGNKVNINIAFIKPISRYNYIKIWY